MKSFEFKSQHLFITLFIIALILTYNIIAPYISAIIGAIILSFTLYPLYKKLRNKIKHENLASAIMVILIILIILVPLSFMATTLIKEINSAYQLVNTENIGIISEKIGEFTGLELNFEETIRSSLSNFSKNMVTSISKLFMSFIQGMISFFLMLFLMFYLFRDGEKILKKFKEILPIKKKNRDLISKEFKVVTHAVIYGFIVAGIAQGLAGGIGFFIFGVPNAVLWGLAMTLLSILPLIGPWLIWFPAAVYLIVSGHVLPGILLMIYGIIIISNIDNLVKPLVIGSKSKIHPALILIGVLGGLKVMGLIGIVIGPLILAFLVIFFKLMGGKHVFKSQKS